jgi:hypothetical protein
MKSHIPTKPLNTYPPSTVSHAYQDDAPQAILRTSSPCRQIRSTAGQWSAYVLGGCVDVDSTSGGSVQTTYLPVSVIYISAMCSGGLRMRTSAIYHMPGWGSRGCGFCVCHGGPLGAMKGWAKCSLGIPDVLWSSVLEVAQMQTEGRIEVHGVSACQQWEREGPPENCSASE